MTNLSRRCWFSTTAGLLACPQLLAGARVSLPLAFSLYGMKTLSLAAALKECAAIGYDGVELALMPGWPSEPKLLSEANRRDLRQQLDDNKLALVGLMENLAEPVTEMAHRANLDRLKAAADLGHALSPKRHPVLETILGNKPGDWDKLKDRLVERLRAWAKVGAATKTVLAVKPHVANALHRAADAAWLVQQVGSPWLKLAFDPSHFLLRGVAARTALKEMGKDIAFVHVKDAKGSAEKFEFLLPGEGKFDWVDCFQALGEGGYRGPIVVEVSGQIFNRTGYDPKAAARSCYTPLKAALHKADLRQN